MIDWNGLIRCFLNRLAEQLVKNISVLIKGSQNSSSLAERLLGGTSSFTVAIGNLNLPRLP